MFIKPHQISDVTCSQTSRVDSLICRSVGWTSFRPYELTMGEKAIIAESVPGIFVSKTKIIICGIVVIVLLILVIVLGAVLGHERSKASGKCFLLFNELTRLSCPEGIPLGISNLAAARVLTVSFRFYARKGSDDKLVQILMQVIYTQIALADGTRAVQLMGLFCTQFLDKG